MITIENCTFSYLCPKDWFELTKIPGETKRRFCAGCKRTVHYCEVDDELIARVRDGDCVAIQRTVDPQLPRRHFLGDIAYDRTYDHDGALKWD